MRRNPFLNRYEIDKFYLAVGIKLATFMLIFNGLKNKSRRLFVKD